MSTFTLGLGFPAGKILLRTIPPVALVAWRFIAASLFVAAVARLVDRGRHRVPVGKVALIGALQTAAVMGLLYTGMKDLSGGTSAILLFTNPIWVGAISPIFLKDKLTATKVISLILGFIGIVVLLGGISSSKSLVPVFMVLGASLAWAASTIISKKLPTETSSWWVSAYQMGLGGILLLLLSLLLHQNYPVSQSASQWFWMFVLTIPCTALGFGLWQFGLRHGDATRASTFLFLVPFFAVVLSTLILREKIALYEAIGAVLIIGALVVSTRRGKVLALKDEAVSV
ncbi:MAG: DMT family transporter [Actinomycetota bacterium]|nr:DMT family transporter [Actinomycetota bacterium]